MSGVIRPKEVQDKIDAIRKRAAEATQEPWGPYRANLPFYVEVEKPAQSLSKHDDTRPTYWKVEDGVFVVHALEDVKFLLSLLGE